jgi:hypothetical protein
LIAEDKAILEAYKGFCKGYDGEIPFSSYYNFVTGWKIYPVEHHQQIVGAVFTKGNEIHVSVNGPWFPRKYVKEVLYPLIEQYDEVVTSVDNYNTSGLYWVKKLGFKETEKLDYKIKMKITKDDIWVS